MYVLLRKVDNKKKSSEWGQHFRKKRSMCVISLIVFTDKYQGHVRTLYTKWFFITFKLYPNMLVFLQSTMFRPYQAFFVTS